jgi:hypothetical protein
MKLNPSVSIESSAGVPIAWAFLGKLPSLLHLPTTAQLIENTRSGWIIEGFALRGKLRPFAV